MAKKSFGVNTLIQSTITNKSNNENNSNDIKEPEKTVGLFINISVSLKKKLDVHCAEQGIKKQDFLIQLLEKAIKI